MPMYDIRTSDGINVRTKSTEADGDGNWTRCLKLRLPP